MRSKVGLAPPATNSLHCLGACSARGFWDRIAGGFQVDIEDIADRGHRIDRVFAHVKLHLIELGIDKIPIPKPLKHVERGPGATIKEAIRDYGFPHRY